MRNVIIYALSIMLNSIMIYAVDEYVQFLLVKYIILICYQLFLFACYYKINNNDPGVISLYILIILLMILSRYTGDQKFDISVYAGLNSWLVLWIVMKIMGSR